jgi:hypothetical protein
MAEPFKLLLNPAVVQALSFHLRRVAGPAFDVDGFEAHALAGLDGLELKARAMQMADALEAYLPADFDVAVAWLEACLGPARRGRRVGGLSQQCGWVGGLGGVAHGRVCGTARSDAA